MTTRYWMILVLYAALDAAAYRAAVTWGSMFALGVFCVLTLGFPLTALLWWAIRWMVRQAGPNTLF
jgi:hypothetical protein